MTRVSLALALTLCAAPAVQAQYAIDQNSGLDTFGAKSTGQSFTPSVGVVPVPAAAVTLDLTEITFYHGNSTANAPSTSTYLNIYDADPNAAGNFVGSSSNSIDTTTGLFFHSPMLWSFDKLTLDYNTQYWAIMSSTPSAGSLDVAVSLETHDRNIFPSLYSGGAGLIANIAPHPMSVDAKFNMKLEDSTWISLGNDLPGALGSPKLTGLGALSAGNTVSLTLANAAVNTNSGLFIGATNASLPFFGGTLVPSPNILVIIPTGPTGGYTLPAVYPSGVMAGIPLYFQAWVVDPTGPQGHTASNALTITTM